MRFGRELNSSDDSPLFVPTDELTEGDADPRDPAIAAELLDRGFLVIHEGRTFHQYTDRWEERNRYCVPLASIANRQQILNHTRFYRLSYRKISASTNERTAIFVLLPPGVTGVDYSPSEQAPANRPTALALSKLAILNSFCADYCLRLYVSSATVNYFFLSRIPLPECRATLSFLSRSSLRLSCNHAGYAALWHEQLANIWRESTRPPFTWPILAGEEERRQVRARLMPQSRRSTGFHVNSMATSSRPSATQAIPWPRSFAWRCSTS